MNFINKTLLCENMTMNTSCLVPTRRQETPSYPYKSQVLYTVALVLIFIVGLFGNLLVVFVVSLNRNMKTSVNIYLINLCIADILVLTVCMPTVIVDIYAKDVWYFGDAMCSIVPFLENTVVHGSVLTLIAISIERYRVICQPLRGVRDEVFKNAKVVPIIWLICATSNIPWFFIANYRDSRHKDGTPIKVCRLPMSTEWHRIYVVLLCAMYFIIPFIILLILYCRICYILQFSKHEFSTGEFKDSKQSRQRHRLRAQVVNIIVCLVLLFFMFHLPYRFVSMWLTFGDKRYIHSLGIQKLFNIVYTARILFYFNHAVNPIIYNFVSSKFRNALKLVLTKRKHRGSLMSSNRRGNFNTRLTRPKNSQALLTEREYDNEKCNTSSPCRSSSSLRQNINEFYPMYAHIIQRHDSDRYPNGKSPSNDEPLNKNTPRSGE